MKRSTTHFRRGRSHLLFCDRLRHTTCKVVFLIFFCKAASAQLSPASPPIANPSDTRFIDVREDWASPSLASSHLSTVSPITAYINEHEGYSVELLQVQWRFGDPIDLYVMKPKGISKPPVILYLYGYPSDTDRFKDPGFQRLVTKDGFAAVGFVSALTGHRYHDRPMREWFVSELQESLSTSAHDVQMVLDYLSSRGDLDLHQVGMFAQGSGATIAILASAVDSRIQVLDAIDPWGDWPRWMADSPFIPQSERDQYLQTQFLSKVAPLDPVDWLPRVKAKKLRLQDALFDKNTPPECKEKIRGAAPPDAAIVIYQDPEQFNAVVRNGAELAWITQQLAEQDHAGSGTNPHKPGQSE